MSSNNSEQDIDDVSNQDHSTDRKGTAGQEGNSSTEFSPEGENISFFNNSQIESGSLGSGDEQDRPRIQIVASLNSSEEQVGSDVTTVTLALSSSGEDERLGGSNSGSESPSKTKKNIIRTNERRGAARPEAGEVRNILEPNDDYKFTTSKSDYSKTPAFPLGLPGPVEL